MNPTFQLQFLTGAQFPEDTILLQFAHGVFDSRIRCNTGFAFVPDWHNYSCSFVLENISQSATRELQVDLSTELLKIIGDLSKLIFPCDLPWSRVWRRAVSYTTSRKEADAALDFLIHIEAVQASLGFFVDSSKVVAPDRNEIGGVAGV
jgi:hypothetical protein|tara:strand:- start:60 stop:506 length:447 start_codon:yes stop_codon:yes gene_type:complete